ncbi:MAG: cob(I)yrinic acid a,c-diamide adenosyltransferase [Planctomycetes bacterium]|nr:cob(I)yrinic acid a,c-diamide adenosyltransferase [Planctomycetota bacterium]
MKLYTKVGDDGGTVLFDGTRVQKCDARVSAYGEVDELNAFIGVAIAAAVGHAEKVAHATMIERMTMIQNALFDMGAELATPMDSKSWSRIKAMDENRPRLLEGWIDEACAPVPELRAFVLPGDLLAAHLHVCRTVCRRAERSVVALSQIQTTNPQVVIYLNRLSDLLFAWSRLANHTAGVKDVEWRA